MSSDNGNCTGQVLAPAKEYNFKPGNRYGAGQRNPFAAKITECRRVLFDFTTRERVLELWSDLWDIAKTGPIKYRIEATREIFDRLFGKAAPMTPEVLQAIQINVGVKPLDLETVTVNGHTNGHNGHAAP